MLVYAPNHQVAKQTPHPTPHEFVVDSPGLEVLVDSLEDVAVNGRVDLGGVVPEHLVAAVSMRSRCKNWVWWFSKIS